MDFEHILDQRQLVEFCESLAAAPTIGFDTEFVSEDSFRPDLCLIQVVAGERLAVIDTKAVDDLVPFWELLAAPTHDTLVHAGREELRFCLAAIGKRPARLFDAQIAAGLLGYEYPAAYSTLISKLLKKSLSKHETRTDWRKRPLSDRQLEYAVEDVFYLEPLCHKLADRLDKCGRRQWLAQEMEVWQAGLEDFEQVEQWRRVSGISNLSARCLAIVRELWRWRTAEARRRDCPARYVLRDDLLVELAKRQTADPKRIGMVRGLDRRDMQRYLPDIAASIVTGLEIPDDECPPPFRRGNGPELGLLSQFLSTALGSICRAADVAPSIVGTVQDVRDLVAFRLNINGSANRPPPALAEGWRAEVVGRVIDDLLAGKLSIRITDPLSDHPLVFEPPPEIPPREP